VQGAEKVNAQLNGTTLTVTNRQGVSTSVNTKGEQGVPGPVGPEGPQGEQGPQGEKGDTGATGPQGVQGPAGPQGQTGVSITDFVKTGETETDTLYDIEFSDDTTKPVAIPKGEKGDQGEQGPEGPQGPMGDVAVITPEQQAAFTMYSEPGQHTNGPMTQKAVTDNLVASTISYENSQSGLNAENVQGAIDNLSEGSILWMNTGLQNAESSYGLLDASTAKFVNVTKSQYTHAVIKTEGFDFVKITAGSLWAAFGFVTQYNRPQTDSNVYYCAGTSRINLSPNTTKAYKIPQDCQYIVVNGQGNKNNYAPSLIEFGKWNNTEIIENNDSVESLAKEKIKYKEIGLESVADYPNHNGILLETVFLADSTTRWHRVIPRDTNAKTLKITASTNYISRFAFVKTYTQPTARGELIDLCSNQYRSITVPTGETKEFLIPDDCTHIIVNRFSSQNWMPAYIGFGYDNTASLDDVEEMRNEITGDVQYEYTVVTGTWDTGAGILGLTSQSARKATDYIEVGDAEYVIKEKDNSLIDYYMLFYDYDKNYIGVSSAEIVEEKYRFKVLTGAYYFVNNLTTSSQDVSSVKFRSYGKKEKLTYNEGIDVKLSDFMNPQQTDQKNIEDCLAFVSGFEKKTIHFDVERLVVSRAILVGSNTTILLEKCAIKQADGTFDNVFRSTNLNPDGNGGQDMPSDIPILENIRIIGDGKSSIIGPDANAVDGNNNPMVGDSYGFRTWQICMTRVRGVEISNIGFTKTRCWCVTFELCENVSVHDVAIHSTCKNGDGIDFRTGCKHCEVYNIYGYTTDDLVACTDLATPTANITSAYCSAPTWKLWAYLYDNNTSSLDIEDVNVHDCLFAHDTSYSTGGHGMICLAAYGRKVHHVSVNNFKEYPYLSANNKTEGLIKIYHGYGSGYNAGDLNAINLNNVKAIASDVTLMVKGGIVENVRANKLVNTASGGSIVSVSDGNVIGTNVIVTNS
jgi:hypothetical protein